MDGWILKSYFPQSVLQYLTIGLTLPVDTKLIFPSGNLVFEI